MAKDTLKGVVTRITFKNDDDHFHILKVDKKHTVKVKQANMQTNVTYEFTGVWDVHKVHGRNFNAERAFEITPDTKEGIKAYLSSSLFSGIGPVKAAQIVKHFGDETLKVFETDIERLVEVKGINQKTMEVIKQSWNSNKEFNDINIFLQQHGLSAKLTGKIIEHYGHDCIAAIKENPYSLARYIDGIGFKKCDEIAFEFGFKEDDPLRLDSAVLYTLSRAGLKGHCYLTTNQIETSMVDLIGNKFFYNLPKILEELVANNDIRTIELGEEEPRYYNRRTFYSEDTTSKRLKKLRKNSKKYVIDGLVDFSDLSKEQEKAVIGATQEGVSVITGGPGTGKSHTTRKIIELLEALDLSYVLCAPTGKAAKRMRQATDRDASTIHRLLEFDPMNGGFARNQDNPLYVDFVILDEASMVDIHLSSSLLRAVPNEAQVLFIGDVDQLPSVAEGNFFSDVIDSKAVKVFRLTEIFRQGKESQIVKFSHEINGGTMPIIDSPLINKGLWESDIDCMFIDSGFLTPYQSYKDIPYWNSLRFKLNVKEMIKKLVVETIPKYHNNPEDVQILMPMKKGVIGVHEMNTYIQEAVNPPAKNKPEVLSIDRKFRLGDKVIQTRNNYDLEVFNGDVGKIIHVENVNQITVLFDDDHAVPMNRTEMLDLELAYCLTIHKSQGSEYDYVILPIMMNYNRMLYKRLIYTALTRGKKRVIFVGQREALEKAVNNNESIDRQSSLDDVLKSEYDSMLNFTGDDSWDWKA